jgi:hypothetical protein
MIMLRIKDALLLGIGTVVAYSATQTVKPESAFEVSGGSCYCVAGGTWCHENGGKGWECASDCVQDPIMICDGGPCTGACAC